MPDDLESRLATIREDIRRLGGHLIRSIAPVRLGPQPNMRAIARLQFTEGSDSPFVFFHPALSMASEVMILDTAFQVALTGGPDLAWQEFDVDSAGITRHFRYVDIEADLTVDA